MALHSVLNSGNEAATLAPVVRLQHDIEAPDTHHLVLALQTTLDLEILLQIFSRIVQEHLPHQGLSYQHENPRMRMMVGQEQKHHCNYRLNLFESPLGEIRLSRNKRFAEQELALFEHFLSALVYPLRNALLYLEALHAAHHDALTGVGNRNALMEHMPHEIAHAKRHGKPFSILVFDIDFFKKINDLHGHAAGDAVLRTTARILQEKLRGDDRLFRYGGEEFVILLRDTDTAGACVVAENLRKCVEQGVFRHDDQEMKITASLGIATLQEEDGGQLFERADQALYQAKAQGRNQVVAA